MLSLPIQIRIQRLMPVLTVTALLLSITACQQHAPTETDPSGPTRETLVAASRARDQAFAPILKKWVSLDVLKGAPNLKLSELNAHDLKERRLIARTIARLQNPAANALRDALLSDEDPVVAGWAAFGLGQACQGRELRTVRALVLRTARETSIEPEAVEFFRNAVADALGRCAGREAEASLRAWRPTDLGEAAARGLLRLAITEGTLEESTLVALLKDGDHRSYQLSPLARVQASGTNICSSLLKLTQQILVANQPTALLQLTQALTVCGVRAAELLEALLANEASTLAVRGEALRALGKLGAEGEPALGRQLETWQKNGLLGRESFLLSEEFGLAKAALSDLTQVTKGTQKTLRAISQLALAKGNGQAPTPSGLRTIWLRCGAAQLLSKTKSHAGGVQNCAEGYDTDIQALAELNVLDRSELNAEGQRALRQLQKSKWLSVRENALELLGRHPEMDTRETTLVTALQANESGIVTEAASALTALARDRRAREHTAPSATPALAKALGAALLSIDEAVPEAELALLETASTYGVLSLIPEMEKRCASPNQSLRESAERQLRVLGDSKRICNHWQPARPFPELAELPQTPSDVLLETDVGPLKLTLDPRFAPLAVARLLSLIQKGAWNGVRVQRDVAGFLVQFGDPDGDGLGGAGPSTLPSELSPLPFETLDIGMALSGRDTGTSQVFITLAPSPNLLGDFPWLGHASGPFSKLTTGDQIKHATIVR